MSFKAYGVQEGVVNTQESSVDWDELNKYVVETAGLQQRETLPGYISFIADLGLQEQEDAKFEYTGTPEERSEEEAKTAEGKGNSYFEEEDGKVYKRWPVKPTQELAMAVDFPDIMLDKGKFLGDEDSKPMPLRLWLGGQFFLSGIRKMVVSYPFVLRSNNKEFGSPSLGGRSQLYKMARAAKVVEDGKPFSPYAIDALLGKSMQFECQISFNPSKKDPSKTYYTEYIKFASALGRGMDEITPVTDLHSTSFHHPNDEGALKGLRNHVKKKMEMATDWETSLIRQELNPTSEPPASEAEVEEEVPF